MALSLYSLLLYPIIFILPAYVANGAPVILGGGRAIDMGKRLGGRPIFGSHKTVRGLIFGLLSGFLIAYIESLFMASLLITGIALTIGTHAGDLLGSFIKRRLGKEEGSNVFLMDQYLFLAVALAFAFPFGNLPDAYGVLFIVVLTGILHRIANIIAHWTRLKRVPW